MTDFNALLQHGNAWLFLPSAIVLGALHGLEPGHSKTMMAAFIIAVRGTLAQAVLLGLAATASHTAVVWLVALGGLYFGQHWSADASEPWLQVLSAVTIVGVAAWMLWRTSQNKAACFHDHGDPARDGHAQDHGHANVHAHHHGHGHGHGHDHDHDHDHTHGAGCSHEPDHGPSGHAHHHDHGHAPAPAEVRAEVVALTGEHDAHSLAHAADINRRFAGRHVTTGQIVLFGLTGGLLPCPASITVLLLCLQLKKLALGAALVLGFSIGLALTMVASGVVAALGVKHLSQRVGESGRFGALAARAPYVSGVLILLVGLYVGWQGVSALGGGGAR